MKIKMSKDGKKSWIAKATIIAVLIWALFVFLIYPLLRTLGVVKQLIVGVQDAFSALVLFLLFVFIAASTAYIYSNFIGDMITVELNENEITIMQSGKTYRIPYREIKSAHTFAVYPSALAFIDSLFDVDNIAIEGPRNFYIYGIKNATAIVEEINKRVTEAKRPKGPTIEDLMREISELREEIKKLKVEREEMERRPRRVERRRFEVGLMEEEL